MSEEGRSRSVRGRQIVGVTVTVVLALLLVAGLLGVLADASQQPPAALEVTEMEPAGTTTVADEQFELVANVTNTGGTAERRFVELRIDDAVQENESVELASGESRQVRFDPVDVEEFDRGEHTYGVHTAEDSRTGTLVIDRDPPTFRVTDVRRSTETVDPGRSFDVSANVTNTGEVAGTARLALHVGTEHQANRSVDMDTGESSRVTFEDVRLAGFDAGVYDLNVSSANSTATVPTTVEGDEPASFEVAALRPEEPTLEVGDGFDVTANVTNAGESTGTKTVGLRIGETNWANQSITLAPGESRAVTFYNVDHSGLDPGEYEFGIHTEDGGATSTLTAGGEERDTDEGERPADADGRESTTDAGEDDDPGGDDEPASGEDDDSGDADEDTGDADEGESPADADEDSDEDEGPPPEEADGPPPDRGPDDLLPAR